jgi:hypothetical protein
MMAGAQSRLLTVQTPVIRLSGRARFNDEILILSPYWSRICLRSSSVVFKPTCDLGVGVMKLMSNYQASVANSGPNQSISLPVSIQLFESAKHDGLPADTALAVTSNRFGRPYAGSFRNTGAVPMVATISMTKTYERQLTGNGGLSSSVSIQTSRVNGDSTTYGNIFLAQTKTGNGNGSSCTNALPISFFNTAANWGSRATQIGPGSNVHLCGTLTTEITFQGSGSAGNAIVLIFESNAKFSMATWPNNTSIITSSDKSYIEIDGGTNGLIEATNNGSSPSHANQNLFDGILFSNCRFCRIHNLTIANMFIKNSGDSQGTDTAGIRMNKSSDSRVDHNTIHDTRNAIYWELKSGDNNFEIDHNILYRNNWSTGWSPVGTGNVTNLLWHDNESYDWSNWDDLTKGPGAGNFHSDGLHLFTNNLTGSVIGLQAYNNYFHGNPGTRLTAGLYYEGGGGTIVSPKSFNNVFSFSINVASNAYIVSEYQVTGSEAYNNTFIGVGTNNGVGIQLEAGATGGTSKNNIFTGLYLAYDDADSQLTTSNYNDFYNNRAIGRTAGANTTLSSWKTATGADNNSTSSNPNLDTSFKPQAGSQVIGVGTNLTGLGIAPLNNDKNGIPRSSSGSWTIGAFQ